MSTQLLSGGTQRCLTYRVLRRLSPSKAPRAYAASVAFHSFVAERSSGKRPSSL